MSFFTRRSISSIASAIRFNCSALASIIFLSLLCSPARVSPVARYARLYNRIVETSSLELPGQFIIDNPISKELILYLFTRLWITLSLKLAACRLQLLTENKILNSIIGCTRISCAGPKARRTSVCIPEI